MKPLILPFCVLLAGTTSLSAASLVISTADGAGADAGIRNDTGTIAGYNYGGNTQMIVGGLGGGSALSALVRFDLAALHAAAGGQPVVITSVTLTVNSLTGQAGANYGGAGGLAIGVNDYAHNFVEGTANATVQTGSSSWNNPAGNGADTTPGGTAGTLLTSRVITNWGTSQTFVFATSTAFVSDVQSAYNSSTNVNYLLRETTSISDQSFVRLQTSETSGGIAPYLTITYTVVPEPATALLGSLGVLAWLRRRR